MIPRETLSGLALFDGASPSVVDSLARAGSEVRFATDETIFLAGAEPRGWYIVLEGKVRVVRGGAGRQHVVHTESAGGTLGEVPLVEGGTHPATGIAAEPTRCALFTRAALERAIAESPAIAFILARRLASRVRHLVDRLDDRSARGVQARLSEFLLARRHPLRGDVSLGMTQQALAEELGTVREVVARELRALVRAGSLASLGGGRYRVVDVEALRLAAGEQAV